MKFEKMRHRIIFLRPTDDFVNTLGENTDASQVFSPATGKTAEIYLQADSNNNLVFANGTPTAEELAPFKIWAAVAPQTGREYTESQKLRAETTYNINTRYFPGITSEMKILHDSRAFDIISVLDIDCRREELKIIAAEREYNGS